MSEIPCHNCITYPICARNFDEMLNSKLEGQKMIALMELMNKCSIMHDYVYQIVKEKGDDETKEKIAMCKLYYPEYM